MDIREWARTRRAEIEAAHPDTAAAADEIARLRRLEADGRELAYDLSVARGNGDLSACERISAEMESRAAALVWSDFRQYLTETGRDTAAIIASIERGETMIGDHCDENEFVYDALVAEGLIEGDIDGDNPDHCDVWNRVVDRVLAVTA